MAPPTHLDARILPVLHRLLRSGAAGLLATAADLVTLSILVYVFTVDPRIANVPALLAGGVTMFFAQRRIAFRAHVHGTAATRRQLVAFTLTHVVGLALNAYLFDLGVRYLPHAKELIIPLRLVASNIVWLGYSFPVWHWVFRAPEPS